MGGVIGAGIAALGADGVNWGWKGVSQVFAAWVIAPAIAGGFAAIIFLITKYGCHEAQGLSLRRTMDDTALLCRHVGNPDDGHRVERR